MLCPRRRKSSVLAPNDAAKRRRITESLKFNVAGQLFMTMPSTLGQLGGGRVINTLLEPAPIDDEPIFLDYSADAFKVLLEALQIARTDVLQALRFLHTEKARLGSRLVILLHYLELDWVLGRELDGVSGVLTELSRQGLLPSDFSGLCQPGKIGLSVEISESCSQFLKRSRGLSEAAVAAMHLLQPMRFPQPSPLTSFEAHAPKYEDEGPPTWYDQDWHEQHRDDDDDPGAAYEAYLESERQEAERRGIERQVGFPSNLHHFGPHRYVVDLGSRYLLRLTRAKVVMSGSLPVVQEPGCKPDPKELLMRVKSDFSKSVDTFVSKPILDDIDLQQFARGPLGNSENVEYHTRVTYNFDIDSADIPWGRLFAFQLDLKAEARPAQTSAIVAIELWGSLYEVPDQIVPVGGSEHFSFDNRAHAKLSDVRCFAGDLSMQRILLEHQIARAG